MTFRSGYGYFPEYWGYGFPPWRGLCFCMAWFFWWYVMSEIGFGSGLLPWCTRCTAFELFSFTSSKQIPISGFSPPMKNKNSQRISGISTNQWRTLKLQRKLFIFLGGENRGPLALKATRSLINLAYCKILVMPM